MTRWSKRQDDVLWEHGNEGAARCAEIIRERCGVERTAEAVRRHAYRIGAPILRYDVCPECGGKTRNADADGLCRTCHQRHVTEAYLRANRKTLDEIDSDGAALATARREYDAARQRVRRRRRKR